MKHWGKNWNVTKHDEKKEFPDGIFDACKIFGIRSIALVLTSMIKYLLSVESLIKNFVSEILHESLEFTILMLIS